MTFRDSDGDNRFGGEFLCVVKKYFRPRARDGDKRDDDAITRDRARRRSRNRRERGDNFAYDVRIAETRAIENDDLSCKSRMEKQRCTRNNSSCPANNNYLVVTFSGPHEWRSRESCVVGNDVTTRNHATGKRQKIYASDLPRRSESIRVSTLQRTTSDVQSSRSALGPI